MINVQNYKAVIEENDSFYRDCLSSTKTARQYEKELERCSQVLVDLQSKVDLYRLACNLSKDISTHLLNDTLAQIGVAVNKAISYLFNDGVHREVRIESSLFAEKNPHFDVKLYVQNPDMTEEKEQSWLLSGDGLAQVVSALIIICILDRNNSKLVVFDECFNGVAPQARNLLLTLFSGFEDFQFLIIEHGAEPVGKHYAIHSAGGLATVYDMQNKKDYDAYSKVMNPAEEAS